MTISSTIDIVHRAVTVGLRPNRGSSQRCSGVNSSDRISPHMMAA